MLRENRNQSEIPEEVLRVRRSMLSVSSKEKKACTKDQEEDSAGPSEEIESDTNQIPANVRQSARSVPGRFRYRESTPWISGIKNHRAARDPRRKAI
ncbi:hypothetical protein DVH24_027955 [Malus domestica]|uniref:Uncharacterized protein n=1 Tax=Malus domestica TaxID=3750 RepID=A0A498H8S3_MALDO|nr:hypothetical protein DVH24_027955 [Malus domestica]